MAVTNVSATPAIVTKTSDQHNSPASVHLDAVRGLAAFAVFISHLRPIFFQNYEHVAHRGALINFIYAVSEFGQVAVMIFFVLSGYLISSSIFRSLQQNRWSWSQYALNRLTRLYVVLIPALILGAFWDILGLHIFKDSNIYRFGDDYKVLLHLPISQRATIVNWIGNLLFCQDIRVQRFGSNGPLWSLANEFWYYVLFPVLLFAFSPRTTPRSRVIYLLTGIAILIFVKKFIALYFLVWLMGTAISRMKPIPFLHNRTVALAALSFSSVVFLAVALKLHERILQHVIHSPGILAISGAFLVALAFSVALVTVINGGDLLTFPGFAHYKRGAQLLSGMSYTLYLVHFPFLVFLNGLILGSKAQWPLDVKHIGFGIVVACITLLYARLVWWVAEANTDKIRRYVAAKTGIK